MRRKGRNTQRPLRRRVIRSMFCMPLLALCIMPLIAPRSRRIRNGGAFEESVHQWRRRKNGRRLQCMGRRKQRLKMEHWKTTQRRQWTTGGRIFGRTRRVHPLSPVQRTRQRRWHRQRLSSRRRQHRQSLGPRKRRPHQSLRPRKQNRQSLHPRRQHRRVRPLSPVLGIKRLLQRQRKRGRHQRLHQ